MSDGKNIFHLKQRIITIKFNYNLSFYVLHFYEPRSLRLGLALFRPVGQSLGSRIVCATHFDHFSLHQHFLDLPGNRPMITMFSASYLFLPMIYAPNQIRTGSCDGESRRTNNVRTSKLK